MSEADKFSDLVDQLSNQLDETRAEVTKTKSGNGVMYAAVAFPVVLFFLLFFLTPGFLKSEDSSGKKKRSVGKVISFTLALTLVLWGLVWWFMYR